MPKTPFGAAHSFNGSLLSCHYGLVLGNTAASKADIEQEIIRVLSMLLLSRRHFFPQTTPVLYPPNPERAPTGKGICQPCY